MRVISGKWKGRPLKAVPGTNTRPTTDKVKEAIFNMIGPYFNGGNALDLFAGSGSLTIEALSRGIEFAICVDKDGKAIQTIKQNLALVAIEDEVEVYRNEAARAIKALKKRDLQFDLVFLDPPYRKNVYEQLVEQLVDGLVKDGGIIVCEHGEEVTLPNEMAGWTLRKREQYGITVISIYGKGEV